jgi:argininosuccinate lyase
MSANEMWGGRYAAGPSAIMEQINASIGFDQRLYAQDIAASKAHCAMLVDRGIVGAEDGAAIRDGLDAILKEIEAGRFEFKAALEDIHMNVESRLKELIGEAAGRLRAAATTRSQPTSGCGCATPSTGWMRSYRTCWRR